MRTFATFSALTLVAKSPLLEAVLYTANMPADEIDDSCTDVTYGTCAGPSRSSS